MVKPVTNIGRSGKYQGWSIVYQHWKTKLLHQHWEGKLPTLEPLYLISILVWLSTNIGTSVKIPTMESSQPTSELLDHMPILVELFTKIGKQKIPTMDYIIFQPWKPISSTNTSEDQWTNIGV